MGKEKMKAVYQALDALYGELSDTLGEMNKELGSSYRSFLRYVRYLNCRSAVAGVKHQLRFKELEIAALPGVEPLEAAEMLESVKDELAEELVRSSRPSLSTLFSAAARKRKFKKIVLDQTFINKVSEIQALLRP